MEDRFKSVTKFNTSQVHPGFLGWGRFGNIVLGFSKVALRFFEVVTWSFLGCVLFRLVSQRHFGKVSVGFLD